MPELPLFLSRALLGLSSLGRQPRLSILIYHRVMEERDWMRPGEPTVAEFAWQMQLLQRHFTMLPLGVATQMLKQNCLPPRAACITFDDGYADNATLAQPVLQRLGIPATVFVAAGYLNGGRMWNDTVIESLRDYSGDDLDLSPSGLPVYPTGTGESRRHAAHDIIRRCKYLESERREDIASHIASQAGPLPDKLMLTTAQLLMLHQQGMEIGGHTYSHPILARLPPERAREEIFRGKTELEKITGEPAQLFAYPNGRREIDYNSDHVALVKQAGFEAAVTTSRGVSTPHSDPFQLPRFTPWDKSSAKFLIRMALNSRHAVESDPGDSPC